MQLLVTLTAAAGLVSTVLALNIPGGGLPNAAIVKRAANCAFTYTVRETYAESGPKAVKTVFKKMGSKPTGIDCGTKYSCSIVMKTVTVGKHTKLVYGASSTADVPYCTQPAAPGDEEEEEEEEEEE
ncbi:hypothetical protein TWF481_004496 [Arthrobotrys musiformis]|uniref:Uncharacterized protein n=1 Tax=Arthrobotrys musiformis TaxID=47236 RepID=A0AAV9WKU5_9PEZI